MATLNGITYEEHEDSPQESGTFAGELSLSRIFVTDWDDRWLFLSALFTAGPFGLPAAYSSYWPGVLASSFDIGRLVNAPEDVTITDINAQQLTHAGDVAKLTIGYSPLPADQLSSDPGSNPLPDGTWATYHQSQAVEFMSVPTRSLQWENTAVDLPQDVTQVLPQSLGQHEIRWHQVKNVPWVTLGNMAGKVNATAIRLPGSPQTFAAETLLFEGLDDEITLSLQDQSTTRKLALKFTEKAQKNFAASSDGGSGSGTIYGWNHQFRPDTQTYEKPVTKDTGEYMFQTYEFNDLWTSTT